MEKLEITGTEHRTFRHAGQTVLRVTFPVLAGESAMALHAKALLGEILSYAEEALAEEAGKALLCAVRMGKLSSFSPHLATVRFEAIKQKRTSLLILTLTVTAEGQSRTVCRSFLWRADEMLRKKGTLCAKKARKTRKRG